MNGYILYLPAGETKIQVKDFKNIEKLIGSEQKETSVYGLGDKITMVRGTEAGKENWIATCLSTSCYVDCKHIEGNVVICKKVNDRLTGFKGKEILRRRKEVYEVLETFLDYPEWNKNGKKCK
jgi:hypothetical protein